MKRAADPESTNLVPVTLTQAGLDRLDALAALHLRELTHLAPTVQILWRALREADGETEADIGLVW